MKTNLLRAVAGIVLTLNVGHVFATTITFDDIYVAPPTPDATQPGSTAYHGSFPVRGYMGFNWWGGLNEWSWVVSSIPSTFEGKVSISGSNYGWSNGGTWLQLTAADGGAFDFNSFYARNRIDEGTATIIGFLGNSEIANTTISLTTDYSHYAINMRDVDRIVINTKNQNILFDNIVVNRVPEPASLALLLAGFSGLTVTRRRKS